MTYSVNTATTEYKTENKTICHLKKYASESSAGGRTNSKESMMKSGGATVNITQQIVIIINDPVRKKFV